jgi:hypothetical protein
VASLGRGGGQQERAELERPGRTARCRSDKSCTRHAPPRGCSDRRTQAENAGSADLGERFPPLGGAPGGPDGFKERTVSLVDIAWVLVARDDVATSGGMLDEPRVNGLRYLEGTPKAATRWIDAG